MNTNINDSYQEIISSVANYNTGIGTASDQARGSITSEIHLLSDGLIASLYLNNRIIQKIVDLVPESARYAELSYEGAIDLEQIKQIEVEVRRLDVINLFVQASISARLFRESYIVLITDESLENYTNPLDNRENLLRLEFFEFDQLRPIYNNNYTLRTAYELVTDYGQENLIIHESRVLLFAGKFLSNKMLAANNYVHAGILEGLADSFSTLKSGINVAASLLSRMVTFVYKMEKLGEELEMGNESKIVQRLRAGKRGIGSLGGLIIDKTNEDVEWLSLNLGGVASVIEELKKYFNAETDLTHDQLWNEGSSDTMSMIEDKNQRKKVNAFIQTNWQSNFDKIINLIYQTENGSDLVVNFALREDEDINSIVSQRDTQATIDQKYIAMGVLSPEEVRDNRFSERYSYETQVIGGVPQLQNQNQDGQQQQITGGDSAIVEDAVYAKSKDFNLTQTDVRQILTDLERENPIIFALMSADQEGESVEE